MYHKLSCAQEIVSASFQIQVFKPSNPCSCETAASKLCKERCKKLLQDAYNDCQATGCSALQMAFRSTSKGFEPIKRPTGIST